MANFISSRYLEIFQSLKTHLESGVTMDMLTIDYNAAITYNMFASSVGIDTGKELGHWLERRLLISGSTVSRKSSLY